MSVRTEILERFATVRAVTERICAPLAIEDYVVQPMTDVSPPRWHLGHVTWFFEEFVLRRFVPDSRPVHPDYAFLFNSYYNLIGERTERPRRGLLTRPTVEQVYAYRREVDARVASLLNDCNEAVLPRLAPVMNLGLNHERQHQELLLADIKFILFQEPLYPAYADGSPPASDRGDVGWTELEGGMVRIGARAEALGFAYDNEGPAHDMYLAPFRLKNRAVTNGEFQEFMADGGYKRPELWLADGWDLARERGWKAPLYWVGEDGSARLHTLYGLRELDPHAPVCHVSYYEADAYARWAGKRLPTEFEWECAALRLDALARAGSLLESGRLEASASGEKGLGGMFGEVWEWTRSAYQPYPGYRPAEGPLGEYNGKFMVNQMVLRGGSAATARDHIRPSYRNFWHPDKRWQFAGIRLADDGG